MDEVDVVCPWCGADLTILDTWESEPRHYAIGDMYVVDENQCEKCNKYFAFEMSIEYCSIARFRSERKIYD